IDSKAIEDIQLAIEYYDDQQIGLGQKFESVLNKHITTLKKNPFFRIRYDNIRCLPLKKFPFMIHFTINENKKFVIIRALFHTAMDTEKWGRK
ncbi:hypothetical protein R0K19_22755, partial [Bacillus sp. SIMBA_161]